jgi:hypothetical protein
MKRTLTIFMLLLLMSAGALGARTAISQYNQTYADPDNSGSNIWTTFDSSNDMYLWAAGDTQLLIVNTSTTASAADTWLNISAGYGAQAAIGDISYSLDTNKTYILGPFESSRIKQTGGKIYVDLSSTRGKLLCVTVP